jgi:hypothetical protein
MFATMRQYRPKTVQSNALFLNPFLEGVFMKILVTALISAFMLISAPAFAGSHGGGKMDDKKVDCSKKENEKKPECEQKK